MATHTPLKLLATEPDDLTVISAMLQDALISVGEMTWQPDESQFVLVASRFRWEGAPAKDRKGEIHERIHAGLCIGDVRKVRRRGFDPKHPTRILELLAIRHQPADEGNADAGHRLTLTFSGGAEIEIEVAKLAVRLDDINQPWPTRAQPHHDDADADQAKGND